MHERVTDLKKEEEKIELSVANWLPANYQPKGPMI